MSDSTATDEPEVLLERVNDIAVVRLNRPRERNPISQTLGSHLLSILELLNRDESVRAVVLSAMGPVFCAGGKLGQVLGATTLSPQEQYRAFNDIVRVTSRLRTLELPVICALNGPAVGGGAALALACDFVIAADEASYMFAFGRVGASAADMGCTYILPRIVGVPKARQLLFTGATVNAQQGHELGLFLDVVPRDRLTDSAFELARSIISSGPRGALAATKGTLMRAETTDFETCLYYELYLQSYFLGSDDHKERVAQLINKKSNRTRTS